MKKIGIAVVLAFALTPAVFAKDLPRDFAFDQKMDALNKLPFGGSVLPTAAECPSGPFNADGSCAVQEVPERSETPNQVGTNGQDENPGTLNSGPGPLPPTGGEDPLPSEGGNGNPGNGGGPSDNPGQGNGPGDDFTPPGQIDNPGHGGDHTPGPPDDHTNHSGGGDGSNPGGHGNPGGSDNPGNGKDK